MNKPYNPGRVWFWKPQRHWFGWKTLVPFRYGHDEYARRVLVFGWTVTGRVLIAVWGCGHYLCENEARVYIEAGGYEAYLEKEE